ncbi:MAG: hypothetical protein Q8Q01_05190 [archaeon]|nr:hypothetical protein [archaeon]
MEEFIQEIKKKKELSSISDQFVKTELEKYLKQHPRIDLTKLNVKSKDYRIIIKDIRTILRRVYGLFRDENKKEREQLLSEGRIKEILTTHSSTKERLLIYEDLYQKIFTITGKPKTILDLGCGLNPFSYLFMKLKELEYHAYDISSEEIEFIQKYFKILEKKNSSFKGRAEVKDIVNDILPKVDVCFLLKMTDVLDRGKGHKITENLLEKIPAKYMIMSFATRTMSGKKMTAPRRNWVEWLCERKGYVHQIIEFTNEIFYVIKKS